MDEVWRDNGDSRFRRRASVEQTKVRTKMAKMARKDERVDAIALSPVSVAGGQQCNTVIVCWSPALGQQKV